MPKLCVTVFEVALLKLSTIVVFSATVALMPVSPEPSPSNEPLKEPENSDSCADEETILLGNCFEEEIIPPGILVSSV